MVFGFECSRPRTCSEIRCDNREDRHFSAGSWREPDHDFKLVRNGNIFVHSGNVWCPLLLALWIISSSGLSCLEDIKSTWSHYDDQIAYCWQPGSYVYLYNWLHFSQHFLWLLHKGYPCVWSMTNDNDVGCIHPMLCHMERSWMWIQIKLRLCKMWTSFLKVIILRYLNIPSLNSLLFKVLSNFLREWTCTFCTRILGSTRILFSLLR